MANHTPKAGTRQPEAYAQDKAAFESLPMGMHERLTPEQSQAIRIALTLGSLHPITTLSRKAA